MKNSSNTPNTIVYACAGCSGAGQTAYKVALDLDKQGKAEMSCLAGIAAEIPSFKRKIRDRKVMVVDGCQIECGKNVFDKLAIPINHHVKLHEHGIRKHDDVSENNIDQVIRKLDPLF